MDQEGEPHNRGISASPIAPDLLFETTRGTFRVLRVNKGRVFFEQQFPSGNIHGALPLAVFEEMVATAIVTPFHRPKLLDRVAAEIQRGLGAALQVIVRPKRTPEEIADLRHVEAVYQGLSDDERRYIIRRGWGRKIRIAVGLVLVVFLVLWIGDYSTAYHRGQAALYKMQYLEAQAEKNAEVRRAIEEAEKDYEAWLESQRPDDY